ncbi:Pup--protein ligase [Actinomyces sp. oral taxon 171]|uniref:Pup--protein ligase n=1 Tax=Actinomyces sp. oral taxon 171 TaxID=706438 RepID=UPI0001F61B73|nr:Pup--protein ligase [Actinomyces sp. oral taxon 171]EFW27317.1 proteasome accessory factor PafA [Actinomyces sp. oral taxon 171 str. F0337]QCT33112.1 Pup--protein ligase [Actinomyces sp. oral taxon 171 str. F0337]
MSGSRPVARRIIGVETEYGITCAPTTDGPPPMDADHAARELFDPVVQRSRSSNVFTRGGARLYLDVGSHPEFATAECDRLEDVLAQDRAGELVMADLAERANARLAASGVPGRIHLLKNNRDAEGNGFGCHENYLVRRRGDFWNDARTLVPHLVTRQILVGAGHIAGDGDTRPAGNGLRDLRDYVFSQRADQMWDAVSSATTRARPLINTRDEPHADVEHYRRMHVIVGDSNIAQGSTLLKVAAMDLLLDYLEHGGDLSDLALADPMRAIRDTCHDMSGGALLERVDGRTITSLEMQAEHLGRLRNHIAQDIEITALHKAALDLWERGLEALRLQQPDRVATELDWAVKHQLLTRYCQRHDTDLTDPRVTRLSLAYHDVSPGQGLRQRLEGAGLLRRFVDDETCRRAVDTPPATTRARLRGAVVARAEDLRCDLSVDWVGVRLDDGVCSPVTLSDPFCAVDERIDALLESMERSATALPNGV